MPSKFLDILPDPDYKINSAGFEDASGTAGQGFASIKLSQVVKSEIDRTISGKIVPRLKDYPVWLVDMNYNPLTQTQFLPVYTFLMQKKGTKLPFYISLPQYKLPKDLEFADYVSSSSASMVVDAQNTAGVSAIEIASPDWLTSAMGGLPIFGDLFNIYDPNDSLHTKTYMVTHVETPDLYKTIVPSGNIRVHFSPALARNTSAGSDVIFYNPLMKVVQLQDLQEYALNTEGLYAFSIKLQEALY